MAAANGTGTAAMLGRVERRISRADRGRWVQLRGVSTASRLLGQCRRSRRRWRRRNLRILWRNDRLYSQMPRPIWRDLAGSGGNRRHRFVQLRCRPIGSFFTTARSNSRAVSLRDWNRLQFRRKKAFSHMRLYQDAVRVEYRQGTACNTPKRKENLKSHHMTPLRLCWHPANKNVRLNLHARNIGSSLLDPIRWFNVGFVQYPRLSIL